MIVAFYHNVKENAQASKKQGRQTAQPANTLRTSHVRKTHNGAVIEIHIVSFACFGQFLIL